MKNPSGRCLCGCGLPTDPSPTSRRGYKKGEPLRYIKGHSSRKLGPQFHAKYRGYSTPCWIWVRYKDQLGYGKIWNDKRVIAAHVLYFEQAFGPVPEGRELHHLCANRDCVNPNHLTAVTRAQHMALEGRYAYGNPKAPVAA